VKNKIRGLLVSGLLLIGVNVQASQVITLANQPGVTDPIFGINPGAIGNNMAGVLSVTVFYTGGGSDTVIWATNIGACTAAAFCGQASHTVTGGAWTLTELFNTGSVSDLTHPDTTPVNAWTLTNSSQSVGIASVVLNGVVDSSHGVVFDRDFFGAPPGVSSGGQEGTPGGAGGLDFTFASEGSGHAPYTVTVQYSNLVTVLNTAQGCNGANWSQGGVNTATTGCGDSWGTLSFTFGNSFISTSATPTFYAFYQDTDLVTAPEPTTSLLAGGALLILGLVAVYRRRTPETMSKGA